MPRQRIHANDADRQAAYRRRTAAKRKCDVTNRGDLGDVMQRLAFVRDTACDLSRDSVRNWRGWRGSAEIHAFALQDDLDRIVEMLDALICGRNAPFEGPEWAHWKAQRAAHVNYRVHFRLRNRKKWELRPTFRRAETGRSSALRES